MKKQKCKLGRGILSLLIFSFTLSVSAFSTTNNPRSNMKIPKQTIKRSSSIISSKMQTFNQINQIQWRSKTNTFTNTQSKSSTNLNMLPSSDLIAISTSKAAGSISSVSSPIVAVSVLAFVILIHEAGHFIAARSMNINVKEFSVGVGPKIAGFSSTLSKDKINIEDDDANSQTTKKIMKMNFFQKPKKSTLTSEYQDTAIDFSLRLIPLGGYVQFPDNYNRTEAMQFESNRRKEEKKKQQKEKDKETAFQWKSIFQNKKQEQKKDVDAVIENKSNKFSLWNFKNQQTNKKDTLDKTKNTKKDIVYYEDPNLLQNRPWTQRAIVLLGGIVFNLIFAFSIYFGEVTIGRGLPTPMFEPGAIVRVVASKANNGAAYGILDRGDKIVGYNGKRLNIHSFFLTFSWILLLFLNNTENN